MRRFIIPLLGSTLAMIALGCKGPVENKQPGLRQSPAQLTVQSDAFQSNSAIPKKYTADGENVSPPLRWSGAPQQTKQFAIVVDDPDAPGNTPWVHWVIYSIPSSATQLPENLPHDSKLDSIGGAAQGRNSWHQVGYRGPEPPRGDKPHTYHIRVFALDQALDVKPELHDKPLMDAIAGHVIGKGELTGMYQR
jgi:Raf kinase inhibitor-like YbhB/YbcL family protein